MELSPFFGGRASSLLDPFSSSFWDPSNTTLGVTPLIEPIVSFAKDVHAVVNTRIDWKETDDAHIIIADLPGLSKGEVKVELEGDTLKISGECRKEEIKEGDKWHRVERATGKFMRIFKLPDNVDTDNITAKFNNGVLVLTIPKVKETKMEPRSVEIAGGGGAQGAGGGGAQEAGGEGAQVTSGGDAAGSGPQGT